MKEAPLSDVEAGLERPCRVAVLGSALPDLPTARRFDAATLCRIAASPVTARCECPHHLVDLISSLTAFEACSEECEILNLDDAALHGFLHTITAQARSLPETALERVIEADNIEV